MIETFIEEDKPNVSLSWLDLILISIGPFLRSNGFVYFAIALESISPVVTQGLNFTQGLFSLLLVMCTQPGNTSLEKLLLCLETTVVISIWLIINAPHDFNLLFAFGMPLFATLSSFIHEVVGQPILQANNVGRKQGTRLFIAAQSVSFTVLTPVIWAFKGIQFDTQALLSVKSLFLIGVMILEAIWGTASSAISHMEGFAFVNSFITMTGQMISIFIGIIQTGETNMENLLLYIVLWIQSLSIIMNERAEQSMKLLEDSVSTMTSILSCVPLQSIGEFIDSLDNKLHEMNSGAEKKRLSLVVGSESSFQSAWENSSVGASNNDEISLNIQKLKDLGRGDFSNSPKTDPKSSNNPRMKSNENYLKVVRESSLEEEFRPQKKNIVPLEDSEKEEFDLLSYY
jgi:hypothetical protein